MKSILILVSFLCLSFSITTHASPKPEWTSCDDDSDCVITRDVCGNVISVHKDYLKDTEDYRAENAPRTNCSGSGPKNLDEFKASCDENKAACKVSR